MGQVVWSPSSLEDVERIAEYITRDSADHAALFVSRLMQATDRLHDFPRSGRVIPEIGDSSCREILYGAYRVMFRIVGQDVWITGVVHGARDWNPRDTND
jgi:plasmid stabilization system protein ParE